MSPWASCRRSWRRSARSSARPPRPAAPNNGTGRRRRPAPPPRTRAGVKPMDSEANVAEARPEATLLDLATGDREDLARLEAVVGRGLGTFLEVGLALAEIRDRRLY